MKSYTSEEKQRAGEIIFSHDTEYARNGEKLSDDEYDSLDYFWALEVEKSANDSIVIDTIDNCYDEVEEILGRKIN